MVKIFLGGGWRRENGTICPFGLFSPATRWNDLAFRRFSAAFMVISAQFESSPCHEANLGLVAFSRLCRHFGSFGLGAPSSPVVLFDPQNGWFHTPKTPKFKGENVQLETKKKLQIFFMHIRGYGWYWVGLHLLNIKISPGGVKL